MISITFFKKRLYFIVARYFRFWSNISLKRWQPRIIAVTGSVGKTTMLHLIEQQLHTRAHYSHFANSAYGISFDILGVRGITNTKWRWLWLFIITPLRGLFFKHTQEFYIVEIDGERPHEADFLAKWLKPEATVWISAENSHATYFDSLVKAGTFATVEDAIANEFATLAKNAKELVLIDGTNNRMIEQTKSINASRLVAVKVEDIISYDVWPEKTVFKLSNGYFEFDSPLPKEVGLQLQMLERLLHYLKVPVRYGQQHFVQPPGRSSFFVGLKETKIIDSTYNAHLVSMKSIVHMFETMHAQKKWVVISDMIEQGISEADEHIKLGELLSSTKFQRYILVGRRTRKYVYPILHKSHPKSVVSFVKTVDALAYLQAELKSGETILMKGSQYLEWVVEKLLADSDDRKYLARQEPAARRRRKSWGLT